MRGDTPGSDYTLVTVDGRHALKVHTDLQAAEGSPEADFARSISYTLPAEEGLLVVSFNGSAEHLAELERFAEASIATAHLKPPRPKPSNAAFQRGYVVGYALSVLFIAGGALAGIIMFVRAGSQSRGR